MQLFLDGLPHDLIPPVYCSKIRILFVSLILKQMNRLALLPYSEVIQVSILEVISQLHSLLFLEAKRERVHRNTSDHCAQILRSLYLITLMRLPVLSSF